MRWTAKRRSQWLFLPDHPPYQKRGLQPEAPALVRKPPGVWASITSWTGQSSDGFLSRQATSAPRIFYADDNTAYPELPANLLSAKAAQAPLWVQAICPEVPHDRDQRSERRPQCADVRAGRRRNDCPSMCREIHCDGTAGGPAHDSPRCLAKGGRSTLENSCWNTGAHGTGFWPWAFSGENAVFPRPFSFLMAVYDHLNTQMRAGVGSSRRRLRVATLPGRSGPHRTGFRALHRRSARNSGMSLWPLYRAGVAALRAGVTVDQVFEAWRSELLKHRAAGQEYARAACG